MPGAGDSPRGCFSAYTTPAHLRGDYAVRICCQGCDFEPLRRFQKNKTGTIAPQAGSSTVAVCAVLKSGAPPNAQGVPPGPRAPLSHRHERSGRLAEAARRQAFAGGHGVGGNLRFQSVQSGDNG